jgi:hypothetical protein
MASGMMVGFTISAGGIGVTLLGMIADTWGVPMAMKTILATPLIALGLTLLLKYPLKTEDMQSPSPHPLPSTGRGEACLPRTSTVRGLPAGRGETGSEEG